MSGLGRCRLGRGTPRCPDLRMKGMVVLFDGQDGVRHRDVQHGVVTGLRKRRARQGLLQELVPLDDDIAIGTVVSLGRYGQYREGCQDENRCAPAPLIFFHTSSPEWCWLVSWKFD